MVFVELVLVVVVEGKEVIVVMTRLVTMDGWCYTGDKIIRLSHRSKKQ